MKEFFENKSPLYFITRDTKQLVTQGLHVLGTFEKLTPIFLSMNESIYQVFLVLKMGSKVLEINSIVPSIKRSFFYLDPLKLCRNSYILLELTRNSRILQILLEPSSLASERLFLKNSRSFLIF